MPYNNRERQTEYHRRYWEKNREKLSAHRKQYVQDNKERLAAQHRATYLQQAERVKTQVRTLLGSKCARCGFEDIRALQVHHIDRTGGSVRSTGLRDIPYWKHLLELAQIEGEAKLELLCANCHAIEHYNDQRVETAPIPPPKYRSSEERSYAAKLNETSVREIRKRYENGESFNQLADAYQVTSGTIRNVVARKKWKWVQ